MSILEQTLPHTEPPNHEEHTRTGTSAKILKRAILDNLFYVQGRFPDVATKNDWYLALAYTVRDRMLHRWVNTAQTYKQQQARTVCYLSAEFLMGPHLGVNLLNLEIWDNARQALSELGLNLEVLLDQETEPGLGPRQPLGTAAAQAQIRHSIRRHYRELSGCGRSPSRTLGSRAGGTGSRIRHAGHGLRSQYRQPTAPVEV